MRITREWIIDNTKHGACNKKQLAIFGIGWPPRTGWMYKLIGRDITEDTAKEFIEAQHWSIRAKRFDSTTKPIANKWKFCPHCGKEL
jgi:hypothetical protein